MEILCTSLSGKTDLLQLAKHNYRYTLHNYTPLHKLISIIFDMSAAILTDTALFSTTCTYIQFVLVK